MVLTGHSHPAAMRLRVGVPVHAEPDRLVATVEALRAELPTATIVLLPDGPDDETSAALARHPLLRRMEQLGTLESAGGAACFNRLAAPRESYDVIVFFESGAVPAPGALERLVRAVQANTGMGLCGPSTNLGWNEQALHDALLGPDPADLARVAHHLAWRFGDAAVPLTPLHSLADFCYVVSGPVVDAVGGADEGFGLGPCWEMEYNARAAQAGFVGAWVGAAYVHRSPMTARRVHDEQVFFSRSRQRYQRRLCRRQLEGERTEIADHCVGAVCPDFAPPGRIELHIPLEGQAACPPALPRSAPTLVSCVMPTADRPELALRSIEYFLRQERVRCELVIVDDGTIDLRREIDARFDGSRVRYVRLGERRSVGHKRNIGCERALGAVIVQWDDDDWYGPTRIADQVDPLLNGRADITALRDPVWFDVEAWRFHVAGPELHERLWASEVVGGTLAFRRRYWDDGCRYPDAPLAEDAQWLRTAQATGARLLALPAEGRFLYVRHATNTWQMTEHDPSEGWLECDEPEWLGVDRAFYARRSAAAGESHRTRRRVLEIAT